MYGKADIIDFSICLCLYINIMKQNKKSKENYKPKKGPSPFRKLAATAVGAGVVIGGAAGQAIHSANSEKPNDRAKVESQLSNAKRNLEGVIAGQLGVNLETPKDLAKLVEQTGKGTKVSSIPAGGERTERPNTDFLYIQGGIEYTGHMQSLDQLTDSSDLGREASVEVNWEKVDIHQTGADIETLPTMQFDGLKLITDKMGNTIIAGVPSASNPNSGLIMLDMLSGTAEDGGVITVGVNSDNPVRIDLTEAQEGYRVTTMPYLSDDHWIVDAEETLSGINLLTETLDQRGIPISGLLDIDRGERSTSLDTEGIPIVNRFAVVANYDGTPSDLAIQL